MKSKNIESIITIVCVVVGIIATSLLYIHTNNKSKNATEPTSTVSEEIDFTPTKTAKSIILPSQNGINLLAGKYTQTVNFYNPKENNCYLTISIKLSNDYLLYQSGYLKPNEKIEKIRLKTLLKKGIYRNCKIIYNAYSLENKKQLNGAEMKIEINSR